VHNIHATSSLVQDMKVVDNLGFDTVEEGVEAAMNAKAEIVVLCSSDDEYAHLCCSRIQGSERTCYVYRSRRSCLYGRLEGCKGIENYVHVRVNVLDTLKEFNAKLLK
jgi:methylmalonyl-CoA mutase